MTAQKTIIFVIVALLIGVGLGFGFRSPIASALNLDALQTQKANTKTVKLGDISETIRLCMRDAQMIWPPSTSGVKGEYLSTEIACKRNNLDLAGLDASKWSDAQFINFDACLEKYGYSDQNARFCFDINNG